jgi:hypothetical protein
MNYLQAYRQQVPPDLPRDWGGNLMRQFPHNPYGGAPFVDHLFQAPSAPGTATLDFDRLDITPGELTRNYLAPLLRKGF